MLAMFSGGGTTYYHQDHLSVRLTTDASGNVASQEGHLPFGEQWYQSGSGDKFVFTSYDRIPRAGWTMRWRTTTTAAPARSAPPTRWPVTRA